MALRKVKELVIQQNGPDYISRPQMNLLVIKNFGSNKSTTIADLQSVLNDPSRKVPKSLDEDAVYLQRKDYERGDLIRRDQFTMPAFIGTINRNREFQPGVVCIAGGKIVVVDEWHRIIEEVRESMLTPLEKGQLSRTLGFHVLKPERITDPEGFTDIVVDGGLIAGEVRFSLIAFGMGMTMASMRTMAMGSRFRLIYYDTDEIAFKSIAEGRCRYRFVDCGRIIDSVTVTREAYLPFVDLYYKAVEDSKLMPIGIDKGYLNRVLHDIIRDAVAHKIMSNPKEGLGDKITMESTNEKGEVTKQVKVKNGSRVIIMNDVKELSAWIPFGLKQLMLFAKQKDTFKDLIYMIYEFKHMGVNWYANEMGSTPGYIRNLIARYQAENRGHELPYKVARGVASQVAGLDE